MVEEAETGEGGQAEGPELLGFLRLVRKERSIVKVAMAMIHAFNTRDRSSGSAWTMRSRAIRARARQLFVIYGEIRKLLRHIPSRAEDTTGTYDEGVEVCLGPFTCEISLGASLRIRYIFGQERS